MTIVLKCGCMVEDGGKFIIGNGCRYCNECNAVSKLHPFGNERIEKLEFKEK